MKPYVNGPCRPLPKPSAHPHSALTFRHNGNAALSRGTRSPNGPVTWGSAPKSSRCRFLGHGCGVMGTASRHGHSTIGAMTHDHPGEGGCSRRLRRRDRTSQSPRSLRIKITYRTALSRAVLVCRLQRSGRGGKGVAPVACCLKGSIDQKGHAWQELLMLSGFGGQRRRYGVRRFRRSTRTPLDRRATFAIWRTRERERPFALPQFSGLNIPAPTQLFDRSGPCMGKYLNSREVAAHARNSRSAAPRKEPTKNILHIGYPDSTAGGPILDRNMETTSCPADRKLGLPSCPMIPGSHRPSCSRSIW